MSHAVVTNAPAERSVPGDLGRTGEVRQRWFGSWRSAFACAAVVVLFLLGLDNIGLRARWKDVDDGVLWAPRAEGLTALELASGSPGEAAGIQRGDVLIGINGAPVQTVDDIVQYYHRARPGTRLSYQLLRLGSRQGLEVTLTSATPASSMYFGLAPVGLFTLLIGAAVRIRRPNDQATLHFFWLCIAFFGAFTFS